MNSKVTLHSHFLQATMQILSELLEELYNENHCKHDDWWNMNENILIHWNVLDLKSRWLKIFIYLLYMYLLLPPPILEVKIIRDHKNKCIIKVICHSYSWKQAIICNFYRSWKYNEKSTSTSQMYTKDMSHKWCSVQGTRAIG